MKKIGLKKGPFYHPNLPAEHRLSECSLPNYRFRIHRFFS
ncbi:hypothetical protein LEP1GSC172_0845 [Leptospira noguchii]|uniref:Uncharacterized protein n=1 Tax=Leptospira noguchii TaxID=28182 RepID=M6VR28_9LEPT|nr:hypothetical protein LEP1GSC172_0845 [Leptospira noguchii]